VKNTADVKGGKLITVLLQCISGVSPINPLVAFYCRLRKERGAMLLFCPGHHTRHIIILFCLHYYFELWPSLIKAA
jgi:hypothetical protein